MPIRFYYQLVIEIGIVTKIWQVTRNLLNLREKRVLVSTKPNEYINFLLTFGNKEGKEICGCMLTKTVQSFGLQRGRTDQVQVVFDLGL